jgi:hypothetical protein
MTDSTRLDIFIHVDAEAGPKTTDLLNLILTGVTKMAGELDALTAAVQRNSDVEDSAIVLLQGLKAALDAAIASGNPAALTALSTTIGAKADALAAAVVANTPAAPTTTP